MQNLTIPRLLWGFLLAQNQTSHTHFIIQNKTVTLGGGGKSSSDPEPTDAREIIIYFTIIHPIKLLLIIRQ